jgi:hypothetical protein
MRFKCSYLVPIFLFFLAVAAMVLGDNSPSTTTVLFLYSHVFGNKINGKSKRDRKGRGLPSMLSVQICRTVSIEKREFGIVITKDLEIYNF